MKAKISEIFKSIQGEGIYRGVTQLFVRFWGCDFGCSFCDTKPHTYDELSCRQALDKILTWGPVHSVALTGGEPLMQIDALSYIARSLKEEGYRLYLETSGVHYRELAQVIKYIDIIAMDFKLPTATGQPPVWQAHERFLAQAAAASCEIFVKAVVGRRTQVGDILESIRIIKKIKPDLAFVLQPQNPYEEELKNKLSFFKMLALLHNLKVCVISQEHKELGIR